MAACVPDSGQVKVTPIGIVHAVALMIPGKHWRTFALRSGTLSQLKDKVQYDYV